MLPLDLDTSRLSISQVPGDGQVDSFIPPPVTPTTRDFKSSTSIFVTPVGRQSNTDVDTNLYSRFETVEQIGKGEFSMVFRVNEPDQRQNSFNALTGTPGTPCSPVKGRTFAVKKSRRPYTGFMDRGEKLREVELLQKLTHGEHVVHYFDHWEVNGHMYIQTEFCEEGSLDKFLSNIGFGGRLDDFRIFKILQDLCLVSHFS